MVYFTHVLFCSRMRTFFIYMYRNTNTHWPITSYLLQSRWETSYFICHCRQTSYQLQSMPLALWKYICANSLRILPENTQRHWYDNDSAFWYYRQVSNKRRTLVRNQIVDHSTCLSALFQLHLHSPLNTWLQYMAQRQLQTETRIIWVLGFGAAYIRYFTVHSNKFSLWQRRLIELQHPARTNVITVTNRTTCVGMQFL